MKIKIKNSVLTVEEESMDLSWGSLSQGWDREYWGGTESLPEGNYITSTISSHNGDTIKVIFLVVPNQRFVDSANFKNFGQQIIPLAVEVESSVCEQADSFSVIDL